MAMSLQNIFRRNILEGRPIREYEGKKCCRENMSYIVQILKKKFDDCPAWVSYQTNGICGNKWEFLEDNGNQEWINHAYGMEKVKILIIAHHRIANSNLSNIDALTGM